jgi:hypothetical protein
MSSNNSQDPLAAAKQAERDLNSYQAKQGLNSNSDSGIFHPPFISFPFLSYPNSLPTLLPKNNFANTLSPPQKANESGVNKYFPPSLYTLYLNPKVINIHTENKQVRRNQVPGRDSDIRLRRFWRG